MELPSKARFDAIYDDLIASNDFFEGEDYYRQFKDRYWNTMRHIAPLLTSNEARMLDVGSGQFAVLTKRLLSTRADVVDIDTRFTEVLGREGIGFHSADLSREPVPARDHYDLIVMAEVIEHVPTPPHVVFSNLASALKAGGSLLVTTPNLYRIRNVVRLALGLPVFDLFRVPAKDAPLGHFLEYAQSQLEWHMGQAGLRLGHSSLEQLSMGGASVKARVARRLLQPAFRLRPLWRDSVVLVGHKPD